MISIRSVSKAVVAAAAVLAVGSVSLTERASAADQLTYTVTAGATSNYVFRGITQSMNDPAFQAAVDLNYGLFYAGIWGSTVDFGDAQGLGAPANAEIDLYAGIRPVWRAPWGRDVTFDFGAIYYWHPGAGKWGNSVTNCAPAGFNCQIDFVELKAGYSMPSWLVDNLTTGTTLYWSPDYRRETGSVLTMESRAVYVLPVFAGVAPSITGAYGTVTGDATDGFTPGGSAAEDSYSYWNVGLKLDIDKFSLDFRYWDSNIDVVAPATGACARADLCDSKFVFSAKVALP